MSFRCAAAGAPACPGDIQPPLTHIGCLNNTTLEAAGTPAQDEVGPFSRLSALNARPPRASTKRQHPQNSRG